MISGWQGDPLELNVSDHTLIKRSSVSTKLYAFAYMFRHSVNEYDVGSCQWKDITTQISANVHGLEVPHSILPYDINQLILIGGKNWLGNGGEHKRVKCLNTKSGEIRELAPMLSFRKNFSAIIFGKEIFVFGGTGGTSSHDTTLSTVEK